MVHITNYIITNHILYMIQFQSILYLQSCWKEGSLPQSDIIESDDDTVKALSTARRPRSSSSAFCSCLLSFTDCCSLLAPSLSTPVDWSRVRVDCIHVIFCPPLDLVTGFDATIRDCLVGITSGSYKMCPVSL